MGLERRGHQPRAHDAVDPPPAITSPRPTSRSRRERGTTPRRQVPTARPKPEARTPSRRVAAASAGSAAAMRGASDARVLGGTSSARAMVARKVQARARHKAVANDAPAASAGGGGKGMRVVSSPDDLESALEAAKNEARNSFGNDTLILEKFLDNPRHIEVQILGDNFGNIIHLYERECSIQRRHQKIIEESPSPAINNKIRKMMGEAAIKAAKVANYKNAGTVEFLYQNGEFYFLEMNTRLQVEHGVTEMVCGIDIVKWQIKIAYGMDLTLSQKDVKQRGHSIECRIYAEDPARNFLPTPGIVHKMILPEGPGVRNDVGISEGQEVTSAYDPLLAKLVVWDSDRNAAIDRMDNALSNFIILGLITNQPFLRDIMQNDSFQKCTFSTGFIEEHYTTWNHGELPTEIMVAALLGSNSSGQEVQKLSRDPYSPWSSKGGWRQGN